MLYLLLPFFLAVQTPVDNDATAWKYGPQYTFSGHAKMIAAMDTDKGLLKGNNAIFKLKCRPRMNDTLVCRFEDTKIARILPHAFDTSGSGGIEENENYAEMELMSTVFEIKFNERGIDSYVIEKTDPPLASYCLDMTRLIANQLSIGADNIADEYTPKFRSLENFTIGECGVDFTVTRKPPQSQQHVNDDRGFRLVALENLGKFHDESIEIEKKRDVDDCLQCTDYFFGSRYVYGIVLRDVFTKLKSSISRIFISNTVLFSETVNESELYGIDRKRLGRVLDHMTLSLDSVQPAKGDLPVMKNPVHMEVMANRPGNPHVQ